MKMCVMKIMAIVVVCMAVPVMTRAQGIADNIYSLNDVLKTLFEQMIPLCSRMIDAGRAIAGLAALTYISLRVWKHLARAEAIDFYPLMRPFAIGMCIIMFPALISLMNGALEPIVDATAAMSKDSNEAFRYNLESQENEIMNPPESGTLNPDNPGMDKYEQPGGSSDQKGFFSGLSSVFSFFNMKKLIFSFIREVVQILYATAGLCVNTIRTFYLIVLVILGPLVFGLSVFDGFQHTLATWFARYINIFMWLPVANIFGAITAKILENMLVLDQSFSSSIAYIVFMVISIIGYTTVPNVAGYIIDAGGKDTLLHKVTEMTAQAGKAAAGSIT